MCIKAFGSVQKSAYRGLISYESLSVASRHFTVIQWRTTMAKDKTREQQTNGQEKHSLSRLPSNPVLPLFGICLLPCQMPNAFLPLPNRFAKYTFFCQTLPSLKVRFLHQTIQPEPLLVHSVVSFTTTSCVSLPPALLAQKKMIPIIAGHITISTVFSLLLWVRDYPSTDKLHFTSKGESLDQWRNQTVL